MSVPDHFCMNVLRVGFRNLGQKTSPMICFSANVLCRRRTWMWWIMNVIITITRQINATSRLNEKGWVIITHPLQIGFTENTSFKTIR